MPTQVIGYGVFLVASDDPGRGLFQLFTDVCHRIGFISNHKHGKIILFSSVNGLLGIPFQGGYTASKHAIEGYAEGSAFVQNLREVKPFEVFTFHEENHHEGAGARFISVSSLFGGEGTTGIIDVMKTAEPDGETWYDLNGRRLQSKPVRKGVYIKNGKKVVVK